MYTIILLGRRHHLLTRFSIIIWVHLFSKTWEHFFCLKYGVSIIEKRMDSYDHWYFIITDAWQNISLAHSQYTWSGTYRNTTRYSSRLFGFFRYHMTVSFFIKWRPPFYPYNGAFTFWRQDGGIWLVNFSYIYFPVRRCELSAVYRQLPIKRWPPINIYYFVLLTNL